MSRDHANAEPDVGGAPASSGGEGERVALPEPNTSADVRYYTLEERIERCEVPVKREYLLPMISRKQGGADADGAKPKRGAAGRARGKKRKDQIKAERAGWETMTPEERAVVDGKIQGLLEGNEAVPVWQNKNVLNVVPGPELEKLKKKEYHKVGGILRELDEKFGFNYGKHFKYPEFADLNGESANNVTVELGSSDKKGSGEAALDSASAPAGSTEDRDAGVRAEPGEAAAVGGAAGAVSAPELSAPAVSDAPEMPLTMRERAAGDSLGSRSKRVDFRHKTYLAPLTTVGNLPFRRVCRDFGVDITCGEMATTQNIVRGIKSEWTLLRRHTSEETFGIQVCGNNYEQMAQLGELLAEYELDVDFVDLNCGCPIDVITRTGCGSGIMQRPRKLEASVRSLVAACDVPVTFKLRTGVRDDQLVAHKLVTQAAEWGAAAVTLHGRTRMQRYSKYADWEYIHKCAQVSTAPLIANGDCFTYTDFWNPLEQDEKLASVMIGRGALIKPWLFTEIKERRHWDISATERFDMLRNFARYGLDYWGADEIGVTRTRRFLLEWLSFLHRYVPVGLLERVPQRLNDRPPPYTGRNELETLLSSPLCEDWVKISERLLGPVPKGFTFIPKHRSNSYTAEG